MKKKKISLVVPCYNEEENVDYVYKTLTEVMSGVKDRYDYEIVYVNNGSEDRTEELIRNLCKKDSEHVVGVLLSRNFGPEASGLAGQHHISGDAMMWIEADLQDPVERIPEFIEKWEEGYDLVLGRRDSSEEGAFMSLIRKSFYRFLKKISYIEIPQNVGAFSLFDKKVNDAMNSLPEINRFGRGIRSWVGFRSCQIPYKRRERKYGETSYGSLFAYMKHAEKGIFGFSNVPLDMLAYVGICLVGISLASIVGYLIYFFAVGNPITASATLFLSVLFFGSMQILAISIVGKYIAIIFEETKKRPPFIVKETLNYSQDTK